MEKVLAVTISFPSKLTKNVLKLQRSYFEKRLVDEPHVTVYLCRFPAKNYKKLVAALKIARMPSFQISVGKVRIEDSKNGKKFYYFSTQSSELHKVHKKVVRIANEYRNGLIRTKEIARIQKGLYTKAQVQRLQKYGYTLVHSAFNPHITLGDSIMLSKQEQARFRTEAKHLVNTQFPVTELVVGLYDFDATRNAYLNSKKTVVQLV